jgi:hypothetical protein
VRHRHRAHNDETGSGMDIGAVQMVTTLEERVTCLGRWWRGRSPSRWGGAGRTSEDQSLITADSEALSQPLEAALTWAQFRRVYGAI